MILGAAQALWHAVGVTRTAAKAGGADGVHGMLEPLSAMQRSLRAREAAKQAAAGQEPPEDSSGTEDPGQEPGDQIVTDGGEGLFEAVREAAGAVAEWFSDLL